MSIPSPEQQQRARIFGVLVALTFVTSIAGLILYQPIPDDADYILGVAIHDRTFLLGPGFCVAWTGWCSATWSTDRGSCRGGSR